MAFASAKEIGISAAIFYAAAYAAMNTGAFIVISHFASTGERYVNLDDYSGLGRRAPALAAVWDPASRIHFRLRGRILDWAAVMAGRRVPRLGGILRFEPETLARYARGSSTKPGGNGCSAFTDGPRRRRNGRPDSRVPGPAWHGGRFGRQATLRQRADGCTCGSEAPSFQYVGFCPPGH